MKIGEETQTRRRTSSGAASLVAAAVEALERRELLTVATAYFVSPTGSNLNPGTLDAPFKTIQKAASIAQAGDVVNIRAGTYHETVTPPRSGTAAAPITFAAYNGENVVIDGADPVAGWTPIGGSVYKTLQPWDLGAGRNQVFVDGKPMTEARWPNTTLDLLHPTLAHVQSGSTPIPWSSSTMDPRALTKASLNTGDRIAAAYYGRTFAIPVKITDGLTHRVSVYCVDYDSSGRSQKVDVIDNSNGGVLATRSLASFTGGAWLSFDVSGDVSFRFTATAGPNAVCSGVFIDPSLALPPLPGSPAAASFVASDSATQGAWKGVYGSEGFYLANELKSIPAFATVGAPGLTIVDPALLTSSVNWTGATINITPGQNWVADSGTVLSQSGSLLTISLPALPTTTEVGGPILGNGYYLTGNFRALDAPTEWFRDPSGMLYLRDPLSDNPTLHTVESKARQYGFNLKGRSYVNVQGVHLFACTIVTSNSTGVNVTGIFAKYLSQFSRVADGWGPPTDSGILLSGKNNTIADSTIEYSAGDGVLLLGTNNLAKNNVIHDVDYSATDSAGVRVWGTGNVVDHNTIYRAGRDGVRISTSKATKVTYNVIHDTMLLTQDGGGIYTYGTDGTGSELAYNVIYNVRAAGFGAAALFLDNGCSNYYVHHNKTYNTTIALRLAPPSHNERVEYNDLIADFRSMQTYGSFDIAGSTFYFNVFNALAQITPQAFQMGNVSSGSMAGNFVAGSSLPLPA